MLFIVPEWGENMMKHIHADADVFVAQHANCVRNYGRMKNTPAHYMDLKYRHGNERDLVDIIL